MLAQDRERLVAYDGVEPCGWLVEEQERGSRGEGERNLELHALSARKALCRYAGKGSDVLCKLESFEQLLQIGQIEGRIETVLDTYDISCGVFLGIGADGTGGGNMLLQGYELCCREGFRVLAERRTLPSVSFTRPIAARMRVVLPAPFAPMSPRTMPCGTDIETGPTVSAG